MSCSHACDDAKRRLPQTLIGVLGDEGFRLFIPLAAVYAALFPLLWVLAWGGSTCRWHAPCRRRSGTRMR